LNRPDDARGQLQLLHAQVDRAANRLARRHAGRLQCRRGCHECCVDGISVFEIEADRIRHRHGKLLSGAEPHPAGACAFLDEAGACRIYPDRPYVCRTQGLPLRWLEEDGNEGTIELRDICPLNESLQEPLEQLRRRDCWTLGPVEGRLAQLQAGSGGARAVRVPLRDLFRS
jgi:Fe-S-cluster containining protein